ncbi:MAG: rhodanese-like domain-containing protein [bacterium]
MNISDLISPPKPMSEEEAIAFMNKKPSGSYQLVDVRQPGEYESDHIPGATLVPLNVITAGGGDLDPQKPTIVYCRSGGRSHAAAQYLSGQGFKEVYDIGANIQSWLGIKAQGPYELSLDLIDPGVDFPDAFSLSYAMEDGLQRFYLKLEEKETRESHKALFKKLAGFEDLHMKRLLDAYASLGSSGADPKQFLADNRKVIEGGDLVKSTPVSIISQLHDLLDIFGLSMAIEAQSLDLYTRMAGKSTDAAVKKLFLGLADEEKQHLTYITRELDTHIKEKAR